MNIQVTEHSHQFLRVTLRPTSWVYVLSGLVFVSLGGVAMWALGHTVELTVVDQVVRYERRWLGILPVDTFTLRTQDVTNVSLEERFVFGPTYMVTLRTVHKTIYLDFPAADGDRKRKIVEELERAVSQPNSRFDHRESTALAGMILGGVCVGAGLVCWLVVQTASIAADRSTGQLTIRRRLLLLPTSSRRSMPLDAIERVDMVERALRTGAHRTSSYQVLVHRDDGRALPVAYGPMFTKSSARQVVDLLNNWLGGDHPLDRRTRKRDRKRHPG